MNSSKAKGAPGLNRKHSHSEPDPVGLMKCAREIVKVKGWRGLYLGYPIQVSKNRVPTDQVLKCRAL
jgi:hypothetical protein